jgi:hypothetical protein
VPYIISLGEANSAVAIVAMTMGLLEIATPVFSYGVATKLAKHFGAKYQPKCIVSDAALCNIHKSIKVNVMLVTHATCIELAKQIFFLETGRISKADTTQFLCMQLSFGPCGCSGKLSI